MGNRGSLLIGAYGVSLVSIGAFLPESPITPDYTWQSSLHFIAVVMGFFVLIAACLMFVHRDAALGQRGWAAFNLTTGVLLLPALFMFIFMDMNKAYGEWVGAKASLAVIVVPGWVWVSVTMARLMIQFTSISTSELRSGSKEKTHTVAPTPQ